MTCNVSLLMLAFHNKEQINLHMVLAEIIFMKVNVFWDFISVEPVLFTVHLG